MVVPVHRVETGVLSGWNRPAAGSVTGARLNRRPAEPLVLAVRLHHGDDLLAEHQVHLTEQDVRVQVDLPRQANGQQYRELLWSPERPRLIDATVDLLLRGPLLDDVADDEMCGVAINRTFPVNERYHAILLDAVSSIPDVLPGDSVWWHCDMVHAVAPVTDQQGWGNVVYIPAAPRCAKNDAYAARVREAFLSGKSPSDFPEEDYEVAWPDRFGPDRLNEIGRRGLGL